MVAADTEKSGPTIDRLAPDKLTDQANLDELRDLVDGVDKTSESALRELETQLEARGWFTRESDLPDDVFGGRFVEPTVKVGEIGNVLFELKSYTLQAGAAEYEERVRATLVDAAANGTSKTDALARLAAQSYVSGEVDLVDKSTTTTVRTPRPPALPGKSAPRTPAPRTVTTRSVDVKTKGTGAMAAVKGQRLAEALDALTPSERQTYQKTMQDQISLLEAERTNRDADAKLERQAEAAQTEEQHQAVAERAARKADLVAAQKLIGREHPDVKTEYEAKRAAATSRAEREALKAEYEQTALALAAEAAKRLRSDAQSSQESAAEAARRILDQTPAERAQQVAEAAKLASDTINAHVLLNDPARFDDKVRQRLEYNRDVLLQQQPDEKDAILADYDRLARDIAAIITSGQPVDPATADTLQLQAQVVVDESYEYLKPGSDRDSTRMPVRHDFDSDTEWRKAYRMQQDANYDAALAMPEAQTDPQYELMRRYNAQLAGLPTGTPDVVRQQIMHDRDAAVTAEVARAHAAALAVAKDNLPIIMSPAAQAQAAAGQALRDAYEAANGIGPAPDRTLNPTGYQKFMDDRRDEALAEPISLTDAQHDILRHYNNELDALAPNTPQAVRHKIMADRDQAIRTYIKRDMEAQLEAAQSIKTPADIQALADWQSKTGIYLPDKATDPDGYQAEIDRAREEAYRGTATMAGDSFAREQGEVYQQFQQRLDALPPGVDAEIKKQLADQRDAAVTAIKLRQKAVLQDALAVTAAVHDAVATKTGFRSVITRSDDRAELKAETRMKQLGMAPIPFFETKKGGLFHWRSGRRGPKTVELYFRHPSNDNLVVVDRRRRKTGELISQTVFATERPIRRRGAGSGLIYVPPTEVMEQMKDVRATDRANHPKRTAGTADYIMGFGHNDAITGAGNGVFKRYGAGAPALSNYQARSARQRRGGYRFWLTGERN